MLSILTTPERRDALQAMGYLVYEDPSRAIHALAVLARYAAALERGPAGAPPELPAGAPRLAAGAAINEVEGKRLLAAAGLPAVSERLVNSAEAAAAAAGELGFPVVMKIVSPDILHKSEIGGVMLNVATPEAAEAAYGELIARAGAHAPDARIDGVLVAPMVSGGVETILGVVRDPVFGPVVMFGLGGIFVEVLKDVTFRIAPFGVDEARRMIREVRGYPMLQGVRGAPPADEAPRTKARLHLFCPRRVARRPYLCRSWPHRSRGPPLRSHRSRPVVIRSRNCVPARNGLPARCPPPRCCTRSASAS